MAGWIPLGMNGIHRGKHDLSVENEKRAKGMVALGPGLAGKRDRLPDELLGRSLRPQVHLTP